MIKMILKWKKKCEKLSESDAGVCVEFVRRWVIRLNKTKWVPEVEDDDNIRCKRKDKLQYFELFHKENELERVER